MKWICLCLCLCSICLCALSFIQTQNATKRHAYLNSFSTGPRSAKYGVNQFSDLSQKEFRGRLKFSKCVGGRRGRVLLGSFTAVRRVSWVKMYFHLFITPVACLIWLNAHTLNPHTLICFIHLLVQICFELHLFPTDLYLRASADKAPLFAGLKTEGLPASFDWRDKKVVAPVQNQQAVRLTDRDWE